MGVRPLSPALGQAAVFLDRDGVLNRQVIRNGKPYPPDSLAQLEIFPEAAGCLDRLKQAGYFLAVVTNQPDIARGTQSIEVLELMHARMLRELPLDDVRVCFHDDKDSCDCRKPKPGLILQTAGQYDLDLSRSFMVGDRWRDIDAGHTAGCRTVLIDYGYQERGPSHPPDATVTSLEQATDWILQQKKD